MEESRVPSRLRRFISIIERWGCQTSDSERYELGVRAEADPEALKELESLVRDWTEEDGKTFEDWLDRENPWSTEAAKFYFTFMLIDEIGLRVDTGRPRDPVDDYIKELQDFGSVRKDNVRAIAARMLPSKGAAARRAIPELRQALEDPFGPVRVWAHCALALIEGDVESHRQALETFGARSSSDAEAASEAKYALEELAKPQHVRDLGYLVGACIANQCDRIRELVEVVADVDALDKHGARAIQLAVGNGHLDATRLLLEAGAVATGADKNGATLLHCAAMWRNNGDMIRLLAEHGADVNAQDLDGRTSLDWALQGGRSENVAALEAIGARRGARRWWRRRQP